MNNRGVTLIELLIAMVISNIIMFAAYNVFSSQQKVFVAVQDNLDLYQNARVTQEIISKAILTAGNNHQQGNFLSIDKNSDISSLRIYSDLNENGKIDKEKGEDIMFSFDAKNWRIKKNNKPLAENITDLKFFYDPPLPDTRSVQVIITARTEKEQSNYFNGFNLTGKMEDGTCPTITLTAQVNLRNVY